MSPTQSPISQGSAASNKENRVASGLKLKLRLIQSSLAEYNAREAANAAGGKRSTSGVGALPGQARQQRKLRLKLKLRLPREEEEEETGAVHGPSAEEIRDVELLLAFARKAQEVHDAELLLFFASRAFVHNSAQLSLATPGLKRNDRMVDAGKAEDAALIAAAIKAGDEYYDSDASDLPGDVKETSRPDLFRNVKWGSYATDVSNDAEFPREPEFSQFVPGRFERLPDGTLADQKRKLVVKLTDKVGNKRIFTNPPPRDWNSQEAMSSLNKRTVQQIRRNTNVRFREVVLPYVSDERRWILANLTNGKPTKGWKSFVEDFNKEFEGKKVVGVSGVRPARTHSSLTKEVDRFGEFYAKGQVPKTKGA